MVDAKGDIALDIALKFRYETLAQNLVQHGANVDCTDQNGKCLLHKAIQRSILFFLIGSDGLSLIFNFLFMQRMNSPVLSC